MRMSNESPFTETMKENSKYRVTAQIVPAQIEAPVLIQTSDGYEVQYIPYAYADFNLAYNPYCVYNFSYSCPIPIPAGEKNYS